MSSAAVVTGALRVNRDINKETEQLNCILDVSVNSACLVFDFVLTCVPTLQKVL